MSDDEQEPTATEDTREVKARRKRKRKRKAKKEVDADADADAPTEQIAPEEKAKEAQVDRTLYIEGIPFDCTPQQVKDFAVTHLGGGDPSLIEDVRLPVFADTGRLRGFGHVVLATVDLVPNALSLSRKIYLKKRFISLQPAQRPKHAVAYSSVPAQHQEPSKTLMLHNLSYNATEEDVEKVLLKFGQIAEGGVRIARHSQTNRSKGFGFCEFEHQKDATRAMLSTITICGRTCRMDYDHGRIRGSFRTADGTYWQKEYGGGSFGSNPKRRRV